MKYNFSIKRALELNADESLIKEEAIVMKESFEKQGNQQHGREMTAHYGTSVIADRMFDKVVEEYKKL